jgi:hypothetical protein
MKLDYLVTADNLPPLGNCSVVTAEQYWLATIIWQLNGKSEILYDPSHVNSKLKIVDVLIEREVSAVAHYIGDRLITYRCSSSGISCNTPEHLKRALTATTFPSNGPVKQLYILIAVATFDNASCLIFSNATECLPIDFENCKRCNVSVDYSTSQVCTTCPNGSLNDVN